MSDPLAGPSGIPIARELFEKSQVLGLIGSGTLDLHIRHSLGFADLLRGFWGDEPTGRRVLDLGSGGGVPGFVLADLWPEVSVSLLDSSARRCELLLNGVEEAGWESRVSVLCGRAEDLARSPELRGTFDAVVARSFGPPTVTAECASGFLAVGGLLVVSDPPGATQDESDNRDGVSAGKVRWPAAGLELLGLRSETTVSEPFHFSVFRQVVACPARYPRRVGMPSKKPLF